MQQAEKRLLACGLILAAWFWVLPAAAGGLDAGDALASWGALSASELDKERAAGTATATTTLEQTVTNTLTATTVTGGTVDLAGATLGGDMFVNLINTGNNVVMQAGLSIALNYE